MDRVKDFLDEYGRELKSGKIPYKGPLSRGYNPELDVTVKCDAEHMSRLKKLIGILWWAIDTGLIDIQTG